MSTYPDWEREILENSYESIDYIALHKYWTNYEKNTSSYLSSSIPLQDYITTVEGTINYVKAKKRSKKNIKISFDEWNPWYHTRDTQMMIGSPDTALDMTTQDYLDDNLSDWPKAPPLYEDMYNLLDALLVGTVINTFINNSHILKIACMAQLVNVIPAISTVKNGISWRQSIYYPLYFASIYGRGVSLKLKVDVAEYSSDIADNIPYLDASAVLNEEENTVSFFLVNRSENESIDLNFNLYNLEIKNILDQKLITHSDIYVSNTKDNPSAIIPQDNKSISIIDKKIIGSIPKLSYIFLRVKLL
jgi:alpha-N-arabinofuranosidase